MVATILRFEVKLRALSSWMEQFTEIYWKAHGFRFKTDIAFRVSFKADRINDGSSPKVISRLWANAVYLAMVSDVESKYRMFNIVVVRNNGNNIFLTELFIDPWKCDGYNILVITNNCWTFQWYNPLGKWSRNREERIKIISSLYMRLLTRYGKMISKWILTKCC